MVGTVIYSKAGRDKGKFMAVVGKTGRGYLVCDGKERPLSRPKLKNEKHLCFTDAVLGEEQLLTDKSLRRALSAYRCAAGSQKEEIR